MSKTVKNLQKLSNTVNNYKDTHSTDSVFVIFLKVFQDFLEFANDEVDSVHVRNSFILEEVF